MEALDKGAHFIGKKIIEEAGEVWIAAEHQSDEDLAEEASQLLYWLQVLLIKRGLTLDDVAAAYGVARPDDCARVATWEDGHS